MNLRSIIRGIKKREWKFVFSIGAICVLLAYSLYTTGTYVQAYRTVKVAHIFPTSVSATGWQAPDRALKQDLAWNARFGLFNENNSAFVSVGVEDAESLERSPDVEIIEIPPEVQPEVAPSAPPPPPAEVEVEQPEAAPAPEVTEEAPAPLEIEPAPEVPSESGQSAGSGAEEEAVVPEDGVIEEAPPASQSAEAPVETSQNEPQPSEVAPESASSTSAGIFEKVRRAAGALFGSAIFTAYATTTDSGEVGGVPVDQPTCEIIDANCYLLNLSGFTVDDTLRDRRFHGVELNLSLAAVAPESISADDKLEIRYLYKGEWLSAGEIHLSTEISNESNGGYFVAPLDSVATWEDAVNTRVVVEYVRENRGKPVQVYLDAAWLDVVFSERAQDVLEGESFEDLSTTDNVSLDLEVGASGESALILDGGGRIAFPYLDNLHQEKLIVRADKMSYFAGPESEAVVYASVTNITKKEERFRFVVAVPDGAGVGSISRYLHNVPIATSTPTYGDVTYLCEGGWKKTVVKGETEDYYKCQATDEIYACASLNEEKNNCVVSGQLISVATTTTYASAWVEQAATEPERLSEDEYGEFVPMAALESLVDILPGQSAYFRIVLPAQSTEHVRFLLTARGEKNFGDLDSGRLKTETELRAEMNAKKKDAEDKVNKKLSERDSFAIDELPEFTFQYQSQRNFLIRTIRNLFRIETKASVSEVVLVHRSGRHFIMPADVTYKDGGEWKVAFKERPDPFSPGEYTLLVKIQEDGYVYEDAHTFMWGVLAINSVQSIYEVGDEAVIQMAALSPGGNTICDADLQLTIMDPSGNEQSVDIERSGECVGNNVVDVPDYSATYQTGIAGTYHMFLMRLDEGGAVIAETNDRFEVVESGAARFTVVRRGPTRIFPVAAYAMEIEVTANEDFAGIIVEPYPQEFDIVSTNGSSAGNSISWDVSLEKGESKTLRYVFDAPDKSPVLYTVGPLAFTAGEVSVFQESRRWQIASDATGNMIIFWDNSSYTPTGWTCVSCTAGDPFYQRFVVASSTYGSTGGAATHTHTALGVITASGLSATESGGTAAIADVGHTHGYSPIISSESNLPVYRQLRVLRYDSAAGEPASIPAGAIAVFDDTVPGGWTQYSAQNGSYVRGESTVGTTGGANSHTHTITGPTGSSGATGHQSRGPAGGTGATINHTHTVSTSTYPVNNQPPYIEVILGKLTATSSATNNMITMWTDSAPNEWNTVSAIGGDLNGRFIKPSSSYGSIGGVATTTHDNLTASTTQTATTATGRAGSSGSISTHVHDVAITDFAGVASQLPPFIEAIFAKRLVGVPVYTQVSYKFYVNANVEPPTDPWPSGATNLSEAESIPADYAVKNAEVLRIRMNVGVTNSTSTVASDAFKLQFAATTSCSSASLTWMDVGAISSTTAAWRGYNNSGVSDGATLSSTTLSVSDVFATYEEENNSATVVNEIGVGEYAEWDWVVQHNGAAAGTQYCFRMIRSDGSALNAYTTYPTLLTNEEPGTLDINEPFPHELSTTTRPIFVFDATDPEDDLVIYQLQVDNNYDFSSTVIDEDSSLNDTFENILDSNDKSPFNSGDDIRYRAQIDLTSNTTTYWWRIRSKDTAGSNQWSDWSTPQSVTIDTSNTIDRWFQTTDDQFNSNTQTASSGVRTTGSGSVTLIVGSTSGTLYGDPILYEWAEIGNAWGELSFTDTETSGDVKYQIEYFTSTSSWHLVPNSDLSGNGAGFDTSPVTLLGLDTDTYSEIRIRANYTFSSGSATTTDWTLSWGTKVSDPTLYKLFDNEKTSTTTPSFEFASTDPQGEDLMYQFSWSTDNTFTTGTTTRGSDSSGYNFYDVTSPVESDPYPSGDRIRFTIPTTTPLTDGSTYWWRVRAKDPNGGDSFGDWSEPRSLTVDTTINVSTWFQTTTEQFDTNTLSGTYSISSSLQVATSVDDVLFAYGEGTTQTPRYTFWNGTSWGSESSAESVGSTINYIVTRAHPRANSYALATLGTNGNVYVQIYQDGEWGNLQLMTTTVGSTNQRGFDIAYETTSGDLLAVYCDGDSNPSYRVWNGSSWSSATGITVTSTVNCGRLRLASDPVSDEIIMVTLPTDGSAYEAFVWSGSSWGNSSGTSGSLEETTGEGMALNYEASGGQAIVSIANGKNNFSWNSWSGSAWAGWTSSNVGGIEYANMARDPASDVMTMCFIDDSTNAEIIRWTGSAWTGQTQLDATANAKTDRATDCIYETSAGRTSYIMAVYSDATAARYQTWNTSAWSGESSITGISRSATAQLARAGDHKIHAVFFDHVNGQYDWSYWNGSSWATAQTLETEPSVTATPYKEPFMLAARNNSTAGTVHSSAITFTDGSGPKWSSISWTTATSSLTMHVQYYTSTSSWALIPDSALTYNTAGTTTGPWDIEGLDTSVYGTIRLFAEFTCASASSCPVLDYWTVNWSEGIEVSGTIKEFNQSTDVLSGTVAVAVNGTEQLGKTGTIANGQWTISNVTAFSGDVITVWVSGANEEDEAVAVTKYDGTGDVLGIPLYEQHLTIGSSDNLTITNSNISQFDNSVSGDEDIFFDVSAGNDLTVCSTGSCQNARLLVNSNTIYRPASGADVTTPYLQIDGLMMADGNTISVSRSWKNNASFQKGTSTVVFTATSTTETIDSSYGTTTAFNILTFGQTSGSAQWDLRSPLHASSTVSITYGTLSLGATSTVRLGGDLTIGGNGAFLKNATTTFLGTGSNTWTDNSSSKQDLGKVVIDGSSKTIALASGAKATDITIGADDTLDGVSYTLEVQGSWTNNNIFTAGTGSVNFTATTTGKLITQGSSNFNNITFNGTGGNWSFYGSTLGVNGNFTITQGIVTMPTATTTIAGSFDTSGGGTFMHSNGGVLFSASSAKTITATSSPFYDVTFDGSGSWSFTGSATTSRNTIISAGTLTAPSGTLTVGGNFLNNGGTYTHGSGTLKLTAASARQVRLNGSSANNISFDGSGGSWTFVDTNATSTGTVRFDNGAVTLPSGVLAVGGSFITTSGTFSAVSGTVKFNATTAGNSITPGSSTFYNLLFDGTGGSWSVTGSATSTGTTTFTNANVITIASGASLEVGGAFTNSVANASTTWTGATLYLKTGGSINVKTNGGDTYNRLIVGADTDIRMWNSSASDVSVHSSGSLYSQDHAAIDGDLYIWGEYTRTTGLDYWSYAFDFDGTALGGSSRQVDVRIATDTIVSFSSSSTLHMIGGQSATTTVANQGVGRYSLTIASAGINAQYYSIASTSQYGLWLTGTTSVQSIANGEFTLSASGTALTLAPTVIDQNPTLQVQQVAFNSFSVTGANVAATGTPTSYWWFRNHYGDFDGEAYDNDPGGNPGNIRWDDSDYLITVSGTVYSGHGTGASCLGAAQVTVSVNGGNQYTGACAGGAYSVAGVTFSGDPNLTVFLNTNGGSKAVAVTRTPTADILNLDLYENAVIVRHENVSPITIENLAWFDYNDDNDLPFTAATSGTDTLIVQPNVELYIWGHKTFAPGGDVTLQSGGSGDARDGRFFMATSSTFTAVGSESHSIGGGFHVGTSSTFTAAASTLTFTATTSGKSIYSAASLSLWNATFNGSGGSWSLDSVAGVSTTTVQNALTLTAGTITGGGDLVIQTGGTTGSGTFTMTGGTVRYEGTGNFGNSTSWQFNNLTFGNGTLAASTTKTGTATTTVNGTLRVSASDILNAGDGAWVLTAGGTPFVIGGTFNVMGAPFNYTSTSATTIAGTSYAALFLTPSGAGSPTYTLSGGTPTIGSINVGDGTNAVTVTADTNDPSITVTNSVVIKAGSTYIASALGGLDVGGSWLNSGTFVHSNAEVEFNSSSGSESIVPGSSHFYDLTFNNSGGTWTITGSATSSRNLTITNASSLTLSSGAALSVWGTFTNSIGGAATTWTDSTLYLRGAGSYSINTRTAGADTYGTLIIATSTHVRMWNSSSTALTIDSTASLYSQDHGNVNGALNIWGTYARSSGSDYWSYATDFDGTDLSGSEREVAVRIASSSSITLSGGVLDIIGGGSATTTIAALGGTGAYAFDVTGGTFTANYYQFRGVDHDGINLSGAPTISSMTYGDIETSHATGSSMITVAGSVISANPLKIIRNVKFATTSAVAAAYNVKATGSTGSSWKFSVSYGNAEGEQYDFDPLGDPGYIRWDNSAALITIAGNVYSDEGSTVSSMCDGSAQSVVLKVESQALQSTSCNASTGEYSFADINYDPGDSFIVFLNGSTTRRAANVSHDPVSTIADMHLFENRVIVRHEDTVPLTILDMTPYDNDEDSDIPFDATDAATDTLVLTPNFKLIIWDAKTFAPAGNIELQSGGSGTAYDGTLELRATSTLSAAGTQSHSIGGSLILGSGATLSPANSTITFTATTTGKTIATQTSSFYNVTFNGSGGNWAFSGSSSSTNDFTISAGTVTLSSATTTIGGSFENTGGTFMHNNGTVLLNATASGKNIRPDTSSFYNLTANGSGGGWSFVGSYATTSNNFTVSAGTLTAPSGILAVGNNFYNAGTYTHNSGTVKMTSTATGKTITTGGSSLGSVLFAGENGGWTLSDFNVTAAGDFTIATGTVTSATGTLTVGSSFVNSGGVFAHATGTVVLNASATGKSVTTAGYNSVGYSFYNLTFNGASGGWTITDSATTTNNLTISATADSSGLTVQSGTTLAVGGTFTNSEGGAGTTWTGTTLYLYGTTTYSINTKTAGGDIYGSLIIPEGEISMWNSSSTAVTIGSSAYLYSQDHASTDGALNIWGTYTKDSGTEYWSRATDFDGTSLSGSERAVSVRIASSSAITFSGATLNIIGSASATSTIQAIGGVGGYAFSVTAGTMNAQYYQIRHTDQNGLNLSGSPTITSLDRGDFEISASSTMITLASTVIDANAAKTITGVHFGTTTGITGTNVRRTGTPVSFWTFTSHFGTLDGDSYDQDGGACDNVRWDDSSCLLLSQSHFRWRNDDGAEGAPSTEWFNADWSKRKKIAIANANSDSYTNIPVSILIPYDSDMQTDFDDIRFTDSSGTTSIPYFIEDLNVSATSTVWVRVPSLAGSGSANIYLYYGNVSTTTASNGDTTFSFFDSFEDDNITEYSGSDASLFDTDTTFANFGTYGLDADPGESARTTNGGIYRTGSQTAQGSTIRWFQYVSVGEGDEVCTFFGVQASGQNYAVCLDQAPSAKIVIAENVTSNDGSGTSLNNTSVTFVEGWYEVIVNWLTTNSIVTSVYDAGGTLLGSVSTSDSSYTSGGMGFGFWGQSGGWDFYSVKPYTAVTPTYVIGVEQANSGATWRAAEDATLTGMTTNENVRLRFSLQNTGADLTSEIFILEVANKGAANSCEAVSPASFTEVPTTTGGCGTAVACMKTSTQFTDQSSASALLAYPASMRFTYGRMLEDPSNQTTALSLFSGNATELEFNIQMTDYATANAYCFRVVKDDADFDSYDKVAEAQMTHSPTIANLTLNDGNPITLTEGTSTVVYATSTVTDQNGYSDMISATSTIYRSGAGPDCAADDNNCYQASTALCSFSDCSGNSCTVSCRADLRYHADPTDAGTYVAQNWLARLAVVDSSSARDTEITPVGVELGTLRALALNTGTSTDYGSLNPGENTGVYNATTTVRNTGNADIDIEVSGTNMTQGAQSIAVGQQKYATTSFTYASCAICPLLTGSATDVEVVIPKPTSTTTSQTDDIYWGLNVPDSTGSGAYEGYNTIDAVAPD